MAYTPPAMQLVPPDKGSFPLDHDALCKPLAFKYLECLKANDRENVRCLEESKSYLECRMDK